MTEKQCRGYAGDSTVYCSHDKIVELSELKPNPKNPNRHPGNQVELLADEQVYFVRPPALAELFDVSERQIQRLVEAGVIEAEKNNAVPYEFDLRVVVPQYVNFLKSKASISEWAPKK